MKNSYIQLRDTFSFFFFVCLFVCLKQTHTREKEGNKTIIDFIPLLHFSKKQVRRETLQKYQKGLSMKAGNLRAAVKIFNIQHSTFNHI